MTRTTIGFCAVLLATAAVSQTAIAQTAGPVAPGTSAVDGGPGLRAGHITATGETVPNPGVSQSGGTTPMDIGIQRKDREIDNSICKGC